MSAPKILWLKPKNLSSMGRRNAVVLLHNPDCPKCQKFSPHFQAANSSVYQDLSDRDINLYRINVHKHKNGMGDFLRRYNITSFPSIILYRKGAAEPSVIRDVTNRNQLVRAIHKEFNPVGKVFSDTLMKRLQKSNEVQYSDSIGEDDALENTGVMVAVSHREPSRGLNSLHKLYDRPSLILFHRPTCPHCTRFMPVYDRVAQKAPSGLRVLTVNMDNSGKSVVSFMEKHNRGKRDNNTKITLDGVPTVYVIVPATEGGGGGRVAKVNMADMTEHGILEKVRQTFRNQVPDNRIAERLTGTGGAEGNGTRNKQFLRSLEEVAKTDCLVLFYAPWCGACKSTLPLVRRLSERLDAQRGAAVEVFIVDHDKHRAECDRFMNNYNEISLLGANAKSKKLLQVTEYPTVYIFRDNNPNGAVRVQHDPTHKNKEHHFLSLPLMAAALRHHFPALDESVTVYKRREVVPGLVLTLGGGGDGEEASSEPEDLYETDEAGEENNDVSVRETNSEFVSKVSLFSNLTEAQSEQEQEQEQQEDEVSLFSNVTETQQEKRQQSRLLGGAADAMEVAAALEKNTFEFDTTKNRDSLKTFATGLFTAGENLDFGNLFKDDNSLKVFGDGETLEIAAAADATAAAISAIDPATQTDPCMYTFVAMCMYARAKQLGVTGESTDTILNKIMNPGNNGRTFFDVSFNDSGNNLDKVQAAWDVISGGTNAPNPVAGDKWGDSALTASQKCLIYQTKFNHSAISAAIQTALGPMKINDTSSDPAKFANNKDLVNALFPGKYDELMTGDSTGACAIADQITLCALVAAQIVKKRFYNDKDIQTKSTLVDPNNLQGKDLITFLKTNKDNFVAASYTDGVLNTKLDDPSSGTTADAAEQKQFKALGFMLRDFHMTTHALFYELRFRGMSAHIALLTAFFKKCS